MRAKHKAPLLWLNISTRPPFAATVAVVVVKKF